MAQKTGETKELTQEAAQELGVQNERLREIGDTIGEA